MEETEIDIRNVLGLFRRQLRLIIVTVILVVALTGVVAFSLTPIYTASTLIMVDTSRKNILDPDAQLSPASADSARIESEVEILRSDNVLLRVIEAQNLIADPEFGVSISLRSQVMGFLRLAEPRMPTGEEALNASLSKLRNAVSVQRRGATFLISLQVRSQSAAKAAQLANAVAQAYVADQVASKVNGALASRDVLQSQISEARQTVLRSEGSFDTFISNNISSITRDTGRSDIGVLQQQIDELKTRRASSLATVESVQASVQGNDISGLSTLLQSQAVAELERQREQTQRALEASAGAAPTEVDLRGELARIEDDIKSTALAEADRLRTSVSDMQTQETQLREQLRSNVLSSSLSADSLTQIYELQQNAELARTQYQTMLTRLQDLETQATLQIADSRVVSPALPPGSPSFPNTVFILALAGLASLGIGITLAFLYENFLGGFTSQAQMESVLRSRTAAIIPKVNKKSASQQSHSNLLVDAPLSVFSEAIRRTRAVVDRATRSMLDNNAGEGTVIMITSTAPAEGKTTVALSLARSYALSGRRTLLIDCDLRKPSIHRHLELESSQGLLEFLAGEATEVRDIVSADKLTPLTIIVGARRSGLPTDQLVSGVSFQRLVAAARKTFDVIVLDTAPIGPVVDGLYIAPFADAIVFVVRWAATAQRDAKEALRNLASSKRDDVEIFTVLNQQDGSKASYRNKYGDYYAEYG